MLSSEDHMLVGAVRRGSREAAAELVRRHWRNAWQRAFAVTGRRARADDVAQDAMSVALERLADLTDPRAFPAWLGRIATRRALDALRAERRLAGRGELPETAVEWVGAVGEAEDVRAAVAALGPERRGRRPALLARPHPERDRRDARSAGRDRELPARALPDPAPRRA